MPSHIHAITGGRSKPLPYRHLTISSYPNQKTTIHFAVRRNFTPKAHHLPLAENITRRRRISLCNPPQGAVAPRGTAKRWMRCAMQKERREDDILPYKDKTNRGHSFVPPSGREGDREAVEGARGHSSRAKDIATGGYGTHPYREWRSGGRSRRVKKDSMVHCTVQLSVCHFRSS